MALNMLQENNNNDTTTTTALSSQDSPVLSSHSSFTNEYDTSNYFYRLPNETVFTILAFVITNVSTTTTTTTNTATASIYPPHKQVAVLSQVCRLFNKIANDTLLWQITFEAKFDSEAIIRAGIVDNNVIDEEYSFGGFGSAEGEESKGHKIMTAQIQISSSSFVPIQTGGNIWKELYKERQIALNKIKNYIEPTTPSPFVYHNNNNSENDDTSTTVYLDDFMEFHFDDESESDNENDVTNHVDSSTLDSTDQVDDSVDYQLFDFDFNFVGNEKNEPRTEETGRNNLDFALEDDEEFRLNGTLEDNMEFTTRGTVKEHTIEEHAIKEDVVKENVVKENVVKEELPKQNITEFNLKDNLEYTEMNSTSAINMDDVVQDLDFVSDGLIKFDDPELDSIFASDTIEIDNFIDAQDFNVSEIGENDAPHNEILVKDTGNSAKEVDHIVQAQGLLNPEINDDLDETYLQDYNESSKLPDYEEETFKSPDYEGSSSKLQNFDQDEPQLQNYEESLTKLQDFDQCESKLLEDSSSKLPDKDHSILNELINDDLPDYDENEEVSQLHDYDENINRTDLRDYNENEELQDFNENEKSIDYQDFKVNKVENPSKEITITINEQESDLPAYDENDEITNLLNDDEVKTNLQNENIIIENDDNIDLIDFVEDEEENLFNENLINEREVNNEEETIKENNLPNGNIVYDTENEQPNYDENEIRQDYENGNLDFDEHSLGNDDDDENEEMNDNGQFSQGLNDLIIVMNNQVLEYANNRRIRRRIVRQDDDPELLKILNIVWKICQENDGMNSEVLLESNIKELTVSLIQSLDKMEAQIECLSIALQILSILVSWHPELTIDLHKNNSFWTTIHDIMINFDIFFTESENNNIKQLALPAPAGSAIHIFFHSAFFNLTNPSDVNNYIPPPQFIPDSNIFNNVYNKLELKPGEGMIQPFEEGLSGKWCGYYAYASSHPTTDSAMDFTLEFSSCKPGKVYYLNLIGDNPVRVTDKVVKEFSGSGIDKVGEFVIKHGIITEKGNVNFIKTYIGRHSWTYDGILLPVGICGKWGATSGNFWVWKS